MAQQNPAFTDIPPEQNDKKRASIISKILAADAKNAAKPGLRTNRSIIRSLGALGNG